MKYEVMFVLVSIDENLFDQVNRFLILVRNLRFCVSNFLCLNGVICILVSSNGIFI